MLSLLLALSLQAGVGRPDRCLTHDHCEFEATLFVPYAAAGARRLELAFDAPQATRLRWRVDILSGARPVRHWQGSLKVQGERRLSLWLPGRSGLARGEYRVRLRAAGIEQEWPMRIGPMPVRAPAMAFVPGAVYYGNLHSQTNHSDGGGALPDCEHAQDPQSAPFGPQDAFAYAQAHGLDFLMASEHNHLYDGATATNADADPLVASARFQAGLAAAQTASKDGFLALYGMEWGVIDGGGHLNIFNADKLLGWERNARGQLLADLESPRSDYPALYALMRREGWLGQFNHPARGGQFNDFSYHPDGDAVMVLCEVMNSNAFSSNAQEAETRRSTFESSCQMLLEAGFHVAFSSNQDNHCANWGMSFTNRTAIVLPTGMALTRESFLNALRARSVFATMDKAARLLLTANGVAMGARIENSGPLELRVAYAHAGERQAAALTLVEGVPGQKGSTTSRQIDVQATFTPAPGPHFYYVRVTQDDGKLVWSAPIWVDQKQQ